MFDNKKDLYYEMYNKKIINFLQIPNLYLTHDICLLAIKRNDVNPEYLPKRFQTLEIWLEYAKTLYPINDSCDESLIKNNIPIKYRRQVFKLKNNYIKKENIKQSIKKVYPSVVMLEQQNGTLGSGFIYKKKDGYAYILTNHHVANGTSEYKTTIYNGEVLLSRLVGKDYDNDIAVLRTDASKVSGIVEFGNSETIEVGDDVFVIGSPLNTDNIGTVTKGIVSSVNRMFTLNNNSEIEAFQIDAAVNQGNSGGPVCNLRGNVVGVVFSKVSGEGIEGIGYAIPINKALEVANKLEENEFQFKESIKVKVKKKVKERK